MAAMKSRIAARRIVAGDGAVDATGFVEKFLDPPAPYGIDCWNPRRLAATEPFKVRSAIGQGVAQIIHQVLNPAAASKVTAKFRKFI